MDVADTNKLFKLLGCYYPNAKQFQDKDLRRAWALALEPYAYSDVKAAAVEHAREKNFWPDIPDLVQLAKPVQEERKQELSWMFRDPQRKEAFAALGLEPWEEAEAAGTRLEDWMVRYEAARAKLPPSYASLKRQGFTYREQVDMVDQAWEAFWAEHPREDPA